VRKSEQLQHERSATAAPSFAEARTYSDPWYAKNRLTVIERQKNWRKVSKSGAAADRC
jgi:hypothetical protein